MDNAPLGLPTRRCSGDTFPYVRQDLDKVCEADERPTDEEYDRYLWLIEEMRRVGYRVGWCGSAVLWATCS